MRLKQRLIKEIEQLQPMELMIVQNFVQTLTRHPQPQTQGKRTGYLDTRKALAACQGNLSDDIMKEREERI